MQRKNNFIDWLTNNNLSPRTASAYAGAINTITKELKVKGILEGSLYDISDPVIIEAFTIKYFSIPEYKAKNEKGNKMYSNSLAQYKRFTQYNNSL